ncbi:DUF1800 family protein [Paenibacillus chartarius]|uniref:DUF1800 family protein n=1 Tax=Paenibacillus chartarius TaxID=747481 RepID=A0ABV6DUF4_9BACL
MYQHMTNLESRCLHMAYRWTAVEAGHLLRRACFSARPDEIAASLELGREKTVEALLSGQPLVKTNNGMKKVLPMDEVKVDGKPLKSTDILHQKLYWIYRMIHSSAPLKEKMTLFWHGHFATSDYKVDDPELMARQNQLFRDHALGSYKELLLEVCKDPAMMIWLDMNRNQKGKPNENFAREVLELFTLGNGHYTEQDVKEAARAFTGWQVDKKTQKVWFEPRLHDQQEKKVLGVRGELNSGDVIELLFQKKELGVFMARKLLQYFVAEQPPLLWVELVARDFRSKKTVGEVLRSIFLSDAFYSPQVMRRLVRPPVDYVVGIMRVLELPLSKAYLTALARMQQDIYFPPDVSGWKGGRNWLETSALLARCQFAEEIAFKVDANVLTSKRFTPEKSDDAQIWVRQWAEAAGVGELGNRTRETLEQYVRKVMAGSKPPYGDKLRGMLYLLLASPEAQMM